MVKSNKLFDVDVNQEKIDHVGLFTLLTSQQSVHSIFVLTRRSHPYLMSLRLFFFLAVGSLILLCEIILVQLLKKENFTVALRSQNKRLEPATSLYIVDTLGSLFSYPTFLL